MPSSFQGAPVPTEVILMGGRWYVAYPLSPRHVEALMEERGVELDHATLNRWVIKYSPLLAAAFQRPKRPVGVSWRLDETSQIVYTRKFATKPWLDMVRALDRLDAAEGRRMGAQFGDKLLNGAAFAFNINQDTSRGIADVPALHATPAPRDCLPLQP